MVSLERKETESLFVLVVVVIWVAGAIMVSVVDLTLLGRERLSVGELHLFLSLFVPFLKFLLSSCSCSK